ncbi:MAG: hypothetical protein VB106_15135 [Clostridiaceae bacterium]|nr:hypothetical protein [Clostridiaceae bacterium]
MGKGAEDAVSRRFGSGVFAAVDERQRSLKELFALFMIFSELKKDIGIRRVGYGRVVGIAVPRGKRRQLHGDPGVRLIAQAVGGGGHIGQGFQNDEQPPVRVFSNGAEAPPQQPFFACGGIFEDILLNEQP